MHKTEKATGLDIEECRRMYAQSHSGCMYIPNAFNLDIIKALRDEVIGLDRAGHFVSTDKKGSLVTENRSATYLGSADNTSDKNRTLTLDDLQMCRGIAIVYTHTIYNVIADAVGFPKTTMINSFGIHKYSAGVGGISAHRDYADNTNLIGIVPVDNEAVFWWSRTRGGEREGSVTLRPADLLLMRSNRDLSKEEKDLRPFHAVEPPAEGNRFSIILRNKMPDYPYR